jgi:hypothetical protein
LDFLLFPQKLYRSVFQNPETLEACCKPTEFAEFSNAPNSSTLASKQVATTTKERQVTSTILEVRQTVQTQIKVRVGASAFLLAFAAAFRLSLTFLGPMTQRYFECFTMEQWLREAFIALLHMPAHHQILSCVSFAPLHANEAFVLSHFHLRVSDVRRPLGVQQVAFVVAILQNCYYSCLINYNFDYFIILNFINFAPLILQKQNFKLY